MAEENTETEELVIGKNSTEALAFLAALDPSNFPSTTSIGHVDTEIEVPGYILEYFLDFIRKLYVKAKIDTGNEAPLTSGLPLSPIEEKLNTLLKGLEERDDEYFKKVPFSITTIRAEKDPLSVAEEMPLPQLLKDLYLEVASQFVEQASSMLSPDISLDSTSTKSSASISSASSTSVSSVSSAPSGDSAIKIPIPLEYTRPNLERLYKIIRACIVKSHSQGKLARTSASSLLSQGSVIELMPPGSTQELSVPGSSKSSSARSTASSETSEPRSLQSEPQVPPAVAESEKAESVAVPSEEESSSSLVKVDMLTLAPSVADMSPIDLNKFAVEIYMTRFLSLTDDDTKSPVISFVEHLLEDSRLQPGVDFTGEKTAKDSSEKETIDIHKFSREQFKSFKLNANKNFQLLLKGKNLRDLKCLARIKDSGKVIPLRAI